MEVVHHQGRRNICREMSPDRAKRVMSRPTFKKVQVVYYISRNGNLEHPHYIEVTHLAHQHLRLKDVLERLTVLRGKEMASLYSWSCKRSYKNGYVWNDLSENDAIFPSEGAEYVLKGSELVVGCTEKLNNLRVSGVQQFQDSGFHPKRKPLPSKRPPEHHELLSRSPRYNPDEDEDEYAGKAICSRGVSTDEIDEFKHQEDSHKINNNNNNNNSPSEFTLDHANPFPSPPSTTSSTHSDNSNTDNNDNINKSDNISKRFEDGDPVENEPMLSRNSMLFNLIACGGSTSFRKMNLPPVAPAPPRKSGSGGSLQREAVSRAAGKAAAAAESEDQVMISYMSENPRMFGTMQSEEKEYFSGSIVEAIANEERFGAAGPGLKKSSSYNQERSMKAGLGEVAAAEEGEVKKDKGMKGKCIPRKKSSSKKPKK